ncbi:hypothetical protein [Streptosporangium sp. LJ11]
MTATNTPGDRLRPDHHGHSPNIPGAAGVRAGLGALMCEGEHE